MPTPEIISVKSDSEVPGELQGVQSGETLDEAADGLFDVLGSEDEFSEEAESEQPTGADDEEADEADEETDADDEDEDEFEEDESQSEESDEDEESDESESEEDGDEADSDDEGLYEVTLPGGEKSQVTLEELKAGYSRTSDYTRKRQRDAEEHSATMSEVREVRDQYAAGLAKLRETLTDLGPKEPDANLRKSNPGEFAAQMAEYQTWKDTMDRVGTAEETVQDQVSDEQRQAFQTYVQDQWAKAVEAVPAWADQKAAVTELAELKDFAISEHGFSEQEVESLADHRILLLLKQNRDLTQTRKTTRKTVSKKVKKASKRLEPGTRRTQRRRGKRAGKDADQLAAHTGTLKDAARAIEIALGDDF